MSKVLVLVEKSGVRYVGEMESDTGLCSQTHKEIAEERSYIALKSAYELQRMAIPTEHGPQMRHVLMGIGLGRSQSWTVMGVDGFSVIDDSDPLSKAYASQRANDAGLVIAGPNVPKGLLGNATGPKS